MRLNSASGSNNAQLNLRDIQVYDVPSFIEFLSAGWQISLTCAIDYTLSNGDPKSPGSLHYWGREMSEYAKAILSVGTILNEYDADKNYPVFGFGGEPNIESLPRGTSHCFPINGNPADPSVHGV